jgi:hypothetical protein
VALYVLDAAAATAGAVEIASWAVNEVRVRREGVHPPARGEDAEASVEAEW